MCGHRSGLDGDPPSVFRDKEVGVGVAEARLEKGGAGQVTKSPVNWTRACTVSPE